MTAPRFGSVVAYLILGLSCFVPLPAVACWVCPVPASAAEAARLASVIFVGTVDDNNGEIIRFSVKEVFRGQVGKQVVMDADRTTCRFPFKRGETYLVYTGTSGKKRLLRGVSICSRTAEVNAAREDLQYLRSESARMR